MLANGAPDGRSAQRWIQPTAPLFRMQSWSTVSVGDDPRRQLVFRSLNYSRRAASSSSSRSRPPLICIVPASREPWCISRTGSDGAYIRETVLMLRWPGHGTSSGSPSRRHRLATPRAHPNTPRFWCADNPTDTALLFLEPA